MEQVKSGDITTNKQYQEALAQIKAEKDRAAAAEAREEEAWNMVSKAQNEAQTAKNDLEVALVDLNGLTEQNAKLQQSYHDADESRIAANLQRQKAEAERDRAEARAKDAENQLVGSRQVQKRPGSGATSSRPRTTRSRSSPSPRWWTRKRWSVRPGKWPPR